MAGLRKGLSLLSLSSFTHIPHTQHQHIPQDTTLALTQPPYISGTYSDQTSLSNAPRYPRSIHRR
jgi:hypothetical protein